MLMGGMCTSKLRINYLESFNFLSSFTCFLNSFKLFKLKKLPPSKIDVSDPNSDINKAMELFGETTAI